MIGIFRRLFGRKKTINFSHDVFSPNGRIRATFSLKQGQMVYSVKKDEVVLIRESKLGFELKDDQPIGSRLSLVRVYDRDVNNTWETVCGEEKTIINRYSETAFYLTETGEPKRLITIRFKVFNDGVAFRYEIPVQVSAKELVILDEKTEFNMDFNNEAWWIPAYQPDRYEYLHQKTPVSSINQSVHTPLTIQTTGDSYISIHEAALYDYGEMTIERVGEVLKSDITPLSDGSCAHIGLPFNTPWRTITIAGRAADLTLSRMILNLNDPPKLASTDWIKPTKYMGIWWAMHLGEYTWSNGERHGATTENTMKYINYCRSYGIPALLIEGWNESWNGDWVDNGAMFNFTKPYSDFDIKKITDYAKRSGIDLIGHHETAGDVANYERQLPAAMSYLHSLGIRYVKTGYVGSRMNHQEHHHSQFGVRHYQKVVEMAAKYGIMVDVHEPIKGTGTERTWPNMLTREGARGQEYEGGGMTPEHATVIPFTRCLAGGFDYTPGVFDIPNFTKRVASTLARQLALYVTIYSAMHMVADRPRYYKDQPAFKFIQDVPVNWQKTVPLLGEIGEYFVTARKDRDSEDWYIGGVTDENSRRVNLYLDFLDEVQYIAEIYCDSHDAHYRDHPLNVTLLNKIVNKNDKLDVYIAPGGGFAIRLKPLSNKEEKK